jgi:hypothetical protein
MTNDDERLPDPMLVDEDDDTELIPEVVSQPTPISKRDGPMGRITIDQLELDELDALLAGLRARRLHHVEIAKRQATARRHADGEAELAKFDKLLARVKRSLDKLEQDECKLADEMNKLRILATALEG